MNKQDNFNMFSDRDYTIEEIREMSEEEINLYNDNPDHKLKIRDALTLTLIGIIPFIFLCSISNKTQRSQRKFVWLSHFIIYAIIITIIVIIANVA